MRNLKTLSSLTVLCTTAALPAHALVLDYGVQAAPVIDGTGRISDSYGDLAGLVDATHRITTLQGNATSGMSWWGTGYDDLSGVAWGGGQLAGDLGRVTLASLNGSAINLDGFDLGVWSGGRGVSETITVYEIGSGDTVFQASFAENQNQHASFAIGASSTRGFVIEWTAPWWVAIDNVSYTATPVPEPASAALLALGVAALGLRLRRRR